MAAAPSKAPRTQEEYDVLVERMTAVRTRVNDAIAREAGRGLAAALRAGHVDLTDDAQSARVQAACGSALATARTVSGWKDTRVMLDAHREAEAAVHDAVAAHARLHHKMMRLAKAVDRVEALLSPPPTGGL